MYSDWCLFVISLVVKAERTPRSERKRRDSFGMFDGYDSCSEESTSSSSSEDSEDEVVPSIPASLPIIKNNGQVYTYPDGKAGMGQCMEIYLELMLSVVIRNVILYVKKCLLGIQCFNRLCVSVSWSLFHSHLWDVWNGWCTRCFLLKNEALLQRVLF